MKKTCKCYALCPPTHVVMSNKASHISLTSLLCQSEWVVGEDEVD